MMTDADLKTDYTRFGPKQFAEAVRRANLLGGPEHCRLRFYRRGAKSYMLVVSVDGKQPFENGEPLPPINESEDCPPWCLDTPPDA